LRIFLFSKNSGVSLLKSEPLGDGSLEAGMLAEFLRYSTLVFRNMKKFYKK